jgi:hypothetical protein
LETLGAGGGCGNAKEGHSEHIGIAYLHEKDLVSTRNAMICLEVRIKLDREIHGGTGIEVEKGVEQE